jgi:hypothetical protein
MGNGLQSAGQGAQEVSGDCCSSDGCCCAICPCDFFKDIGQTVGGCCSCGNGIGGCIGGICPGDLGDLGGCIGGVCMGGCKLVGGVGECLCKAGPGQLVGCLCSCGGGVLQLLDNVNFCNLIGELFDCLFGIIASGNINI